MQRPERFLPRRGLCVFRVGYVRGRSLRLAAADPGSRRDDETVLQAGVRAWSSRGGWVGWLALLTVGMVACRPRVEVA